MIINLTTKFSDWIFFLTHVFSLLQWKDVVDILITSVILYFIFVFIKQSRSWVIPYALGAYLIIIYLAKTLNLGLTRQIFQLLATVFLLIFIIIFQRELRRFFDWVLISSRRLTNPHPRQLSKEVSFSIIKAIKEMVEKKIGAIIVLPGELSLENVVEGGFLLDGRVSSPVLLSIFDTSSPGHDGAVIIDNNRIRKFGVHLPLAENYTGFDRAGTRHRAALGVTEKTDALVIVVSEERGEVSIAENGQLTKISEFHLLEEKISRFIAQAQEPEFDLFWRVFFVKNWRLKILVFSLTIFLWFSLVFQAGVINKEISIPIEARFLDKNYQITSITPKAVRLTLTGSNQDFNNFTNDQAKVFIDLREMKQGEKEIELKRQDIELPRYLSLIKISPQKVQVVVAPAPDNY